MLWVSSHFLTVLGLEHPHNCQNIAKKFYWSDRALYFMLDSDSPFSMGSFMNVGMFWMCASNEFSQRRLSLINYLICDPGKIWMSLIYCLKILFGMAGLLGFLVDTWVNVYCVPLKVKANCDWEAIEISTEEGDARGSRYGDICIKKKK